MTDFATINELFGSISENNFILSGTGWGIVNINDIFIKYHTG